MHVGGRGRRWALVLPVPAATVVLVVGLSGLLSRGERAPLAATSPGPAAASTPASSPVDPTGLRPGSGYVVGLPRVVQRPIPYPSTRKAQMAVYARAHYGISTWRLTPTAVVLHFTESDSVSGVINHFAANRPNHGQLPGVCAHYLVDTDGTVYQLVSTSVMCRHAIGMNHRAIGIEVMQSTHGNSSAWADRQILDRPAQSRSLLLLVASLQDRYGIATSHVYGHGTANSAPEFRDRQGWRNTHTDWGAPAVAEFRRRLTALSARG